MNANEVIANVALEIAGYPKARYDIVHPIDDVNRSQSTNDTYPTAIKLSMTASLTTMLTGSTSCASRSAARAGSSTRSSRSAARSCRTRCR